MWAEAVKVLAHNRCCVAGCTIVERLNAHHIENYATTQSLRYDIRNGKCCCPAHHKWGKDSFHKSICFTLKQITPEDIDYLNIHRNDHVDFTVEYYEAKLKELQQIIDSYKS